MVRNGSKSAFVVRIVDLRFISGHGSLQEECLKERKARKEDGRGKS